MSKKLDDFKKKFKTEELLLHETKYWIWSLRPAQSTLGAGVLSLKRECSSLVELRPEEFSDLNNIIKVVERTLKVTFDYDVMNYLMLMMVDKQVHYHIIPRYAETVNFNEILWKDSSWPGIPNLGGEETDSEMLTVILSEIKEKLVL